VVNDADIRSRIEWARFLAGFLVVFALFQGAATRLESDRGQAGIIVCAIVVAATLIAERMWFRPTVRAAALSLGLGAPRVAGLAVAAAVSMVLLFIVPAYAAAAGMRWSIRSDALTLLPGLFAQAGVAEEILFRGYLFGHLRRGRSFWSAAVLSMLPFVLVHLFMFVNLPWPVALASLLLSVVISFPMAHLFELGGGTIWPPALLHFVVQGTVKVIDLAGEGTASFPLVWISASAVVPVTVFLIRSPQHRDRTRGMIHE
jgi:membrane protease YdiL (CAAX protease family)